jgi:hypothetical protein
VLQLDEADRVVEVARVAHDRDSGGDADAGRDGPAHLPGRGPQLDLIAGQ